MKIDWFTAAAQIVNLFILIWLLKKFLYRPVLNVMQQRQEKIAATLEDARQEREAAEEEKKSYQELRDGAEKEVRQKLAKAEQEAEDLRQRLMQEAKEEQKKARRKWQMELEKEEERFLNRTTRTIADEFGRLSQAAFRELADQHFTESMVGRFLEQTREGRNKDILASLREGGNQSVQVSSSHELNESLREEVEKQLREICGRDMEVVFDTDPGLLAGIIVEVDGRKVGWHLTQYLNDFQARLGESLAQSRVSGRESS